MFRDLSPHCLPCLHLGQRSGLPPACPALVFTSFILSSSPLCSTELSSMGVTQWNLEKLISAQTESKVRRHLLGYAGFHAWDRALPLCCVGHCRALSLHPGDPRFPAGSRYILCWCGILRDKQRAINVKCDSYSIILKVSPPYLHNRVESDCLPQKIYVDQDCVQTLIVLIK